MRGSLFIKVFLGFWLVMLAIVGSWNLTEDYFQSQPPKKEDKINAYIL